MSNKSKTLLDSTEQQFLAARKTKGFIVYFFTLLPVILAIALMLLLLVSVISDTYTWQVVKPNRSSSGQTFDLKKARSWEKVVRLELTSQGKTPKEIEDFFLDGDEIRKFKARYKVELVWVPKSIYGQDSGWRWVVSGSRDKLVDNYDYWQGLRINKDVAGLTSKGESYWNNSSWQQELHAWLEQLPAGTAKCDSDFPDAPKKEFDFTKVESAVGKNHWKNISGQQGLYFGLEQLSVEVAQCNLVAAAVIRGEFNLAQAESKVREILENLEPNATGDLLEHVMSTRYMLKSLTDEKKHREHVATIASNIANSHNLYLNPWFDLGFFTRNNSGRAWLAGLSTALLGTLWVIGLVIIITLPFGVGAALYLEEYAPVNAFSGFLEVNLRNLAGIPSIVYGILGLYVFVRFMKIGPTILAAALTLSLLILPVIIIAAREAIRSVPDSLRQASYGLGATKWQTVRRVVLPNSIAGIVTGVILSVARAIGETAPLLLVGGAGFVTQLPSHPLSSYVVMPTQIYSWIGAPQNAFDHAAAAGIVALLLVLTILYIIAFFIRQHFEHKY